MYRVKELNNIYQNINHQLKLNNIVSDLSDNQVKEQIYYHLDIYLDEDEEEEVDEDEVYLGDEEDLAEQLEEIYLGVDINEKNYLEDKENTNLILKAVSN